MNAGIQNLVVSLGLMQGTLFRVLVCISQLIRLLLFAVARKIPFEDPQVILYVRISYVVAQVLILGIYYYISAMVRVSQRRCGRVDIVCGRSRSRTI